MADRTAPCTHGVALSLDRNGHCLLDCTAAIRDTALPKLVGYDWFKNANCITSNTAALLDKTIKIESLFLNHPGLMKELLKLMSLLITISAALTLGAGSLNAIFGWDLGLRIGGSSIPLPDDFFSIVAIAILLLIIAGLFYAIADIKRIWRFVNRYRWRVFGSIVAVTAILVIGVPRAFPEFFLEIAVQEGQSAQATDMLEQRDYPPEFLNSLTYWSLKNTDFPLTEKLLAKGADLNHRRASESTLLHAAVAHFPASSIEFLIRQTIDLNAQNQSGDTALHALILYRAVQGEDTSEATILSLVKQLVEAGADPTIANNRQKTPLDYAKSSQYSTVVEYLQTRP